MGQKILADGIDILDDPRRHRGLRSRIFDGEGTPTRARKLVEDGVLMSWLLDSRSARQLGLTSTGHAARGTSGPPSPSPSNLYMAAGKLSPAELMADIAEGVYLTELIGMGVNGLTGGLFARRRRLHDPQRRVGRAGRRDHRCRQPDRYVCQSCSANDLVFRRGTDAPTLRIEGLMVAGA